MAGRSVIAAVQSSRRGERTPSFTGVDLDIGLSNLRKMKPSADSTLEDLENDRWPAPEFTSHLVTTVHQLRKKRLSAFKTEDLRIMIGQRQGVRFLLPMALARLTENPFADGDLFDGDLLMAVASLPSCDLLFDSRSKPLLTSVCERALQSTEPSLSRRDREKVYGLLKKIQVG